MYAAALQEVFFILLFVRSPFSPPYRLSSYRPSPFSSSIHSILPPSSALGFIYFFSGEKGGEGKGEEKEKKRKKGKGENQWGRGKGIKLKVEFIFLGKMRREKRGGKKRKSKKREKKKKKKKKEQSKANVASVLQVCKIPCFFSLCHSSSLSSSF